MNSRVKRLMWAVSAMAALMLILGTSMTVLAQAPRRRPQRKPRRAPAEKRT
jgi:hypothetical protein